MKAKQPFIVAFLLFITLGVARAGEIHDAAGAGQIEKVKALLSANPEFVNAKDHNNQTPLHWAASMDYKEVVELLLASGADVTVKDDFGRTPIQAAEGWHRAEIVDLLRQPAAKAANRELEEGLSATKQQQWAVAIRHFQKAQDLTPTAPEVLFNLGLAESKVPGRELRAMAWLQAYLLSATNAANADAVRREIGDLSVRVEGNLEKLFIMAKQLATKSSGDQRWGAYFRIARVQAIAGDMDSARQTLANVAQDPTLVDKTCRTFQSENDMTLKFKHDFNQVDYEAVGTNHVKQLIYIVNHGMNDEPFTDLPTVIQTIAAKPKSEDMLVATTDIIEQIVRRFNDVQKLGR